MKKIVALVLCLVMVVGLMAGCEKAMDVKTLAQKMDEAAKDVTAMGGKFAMEMEMSMGMTGMTMTMGVKADGEMKYDLANGGIYADVNANVEALGQTEAVDMEVYVTVAEDGSSTMYMHESETDSWIKYAQEGYAEQLEELQGMTIAMSDVPEEKMTLAKEKQTVSGVECYVLTMELDGTYFTDEMKAMMGTAAESLDEETAAMMESIDWSALNAKAVYYVDAKTFNTVQMDMEMLGLGDMMSGIMDTAMAEMKELMGGEEMEITIDVPVCKISMSEMSYTGVEVPAVPQEAIDNAVDANAMAEEPVVDDTYTDESMLNNPAQADGSFLLTYEPMTARVVVPEGLTVYMSEPDMLLLMNDDMSMSISYMLVGETDAATVSAEYEDMVQTAKDEGVWMSNGDAEDINGFTVKNLIYNDGTSEVYSWKEVNGGVVMVNCASYMDIPVLDEVLNNIEIGE